MRIGERLLEQRKIRQNELDSALAAQKRKPQRLISLLIETGVLELDDAARVLGVHRGMPCVLSKHLAARDPKVAKLVPAELARAWCALALGRTSSGALIVCVRDPDPSLASALEKATRSQITLVIAPASKLEHLVETEYGPLTEEFDVDLASAADLKPAPQPPLPDMDLLDPESVRLALTDLDDSRVAKDPTTPPSNKSRNLPPPPPSIDQTRAALEQATSRDAATDAAVRYLAGRWRSGIVLAIRGTTAIGYRGHGDAVGKVETISVSVATPSTVQRAIESRRTSIQLVDGTTQEELSRRLGTTSLSAAPVLVAGQVVAVVVVGDPIHGLGDTERSIHELSKLSQLLGAAYERMVGTR
jgi:hypothetical protein